MFEKEAEELIEESKRLNTTPRETVRKAIEFGFQKGIKAKINTTTISDCPIKDEWHYVKDGDLPKDNKEVLVYMWDSFYIGYYNLQWHFEAFSEESEQVTAWKEIVPPKE
jgi:hypothetical protein